MRPVDGFAWLSPGRSVLPVGRAEELVPLRVEGAAAPSAAVAAALRRVDRGFELAQPRLVLLGCGLRGDELENHLVHEQAPASWQDPTALDAVYAIG